MSNKEQSVQIPDEDEYENRTEQPMRTVKETYREQVAYDYYMDKL